MATCVSSQRDRDRKRVHALYQPHEPYGWDVCPYCGDQATTRDHVTPVWYAAGLDLDDPFTPLPPLLIVPCCMDCNVRLSGFVAFSVVDKRDELKRRLRQRWGTLLGGYDWQPEELTQLGPTLRRKIEAMEGKRAAILRRLAFPTAEEEVLLRVARDPPVPKSRQKAPPRPRQGPYTADLPPEQTETAQPWLGPLLGASTAVLPLPPDWGLLAENWGAPQLSFLPVLDWMLELLR